MSARLSIDLPDELVEAIAERVLERLEAREHSEPEPWIGVREAAEHLACPCSRIYSLVHRKDSTRIPHQKDGTRLLFRRSELDRWLESTEDV